MTSKSDSTTSWKEQRRQELAQQKRKRILTLWIPVAVIIVVVASLALYRIFQPELAGVVAFGVQSRAHDQSATFAETGLPPTGGAHHPNWQNCGIYDTPVDNALAVHSLEHGAVWLTYHPDLPAEKVEPLQDIVRSNSYTLMSPYPNLSAEVVMSAWGRQLVIGSLPDERITEFISRYRHQGPEPGAPCTGGVGVPLQ
jgi:hypothetical protein